MENKNKSPSDSGESFEQRERGSGGRTLPVRLADYSDKLEHLCERADRIAALLAISMYAIISIAVAAIVIALKLK